MNKSDLISALSTKENLTDKKCIRHCVAVKKEPKAVKGRPRKMAKKVAKRKPGEKRITNIDSFLGLAQNSTEGISTAELMKKTELAERQIWSIVYRAAKEGKIGKLKRGAYGAA